MQLLGKKGYTLIEVLIAVAIFSTIVTISTMALNQGLMQYHGILERGVNFWDNAKYLWINKSFNSTVNYYVHSRNDGWFPYFRGNQEVISYVSLSPLAENKPVIAWIRNERDTNGRSLVYYELPVYTKNIKDIEREDFFRTSKKENTITLLKGIESVYITFYSYNMEERKYLWTREFYGEKEKSLPLAIKIDYRKVGEAVGRMITFNINTNSRMKRGYNELYTFK